jgi:type VI secretion system protein VasD
VTHSAHDTGPGRGSRWLFAALTITAALAACGKAPPPAPPAAPVITIAAPPDARIKATMTLSATADTNPDATGRPSPVVVRVFQLRGDGAFSAADYFPLYDDDKMVLGPELITRDEFVLAPGDRRSLEVTLAADTRFVGAIAAFRDIRNAQWRALIPAASNGLTVTVERSRIAVSSSGN